jgi:hypothetical protein
LTRGKPDNRKRSTNSRANSAARCRTSRTATKTKSSHPSATPTGKGIANKAGCVSYRGSSGHCFKGCSFGVIKTPNDFWSIKGGSNSPSKRIIDVLSCIRDGCATGCGFGNSLKGFATL